MAPVLEQLEKLGGGVYENEELDQGRAIGPGQGPGRD